MIVAVTAGPGIMSVWNIASRSGLDEPTIRDLLDELRIDVRSHDADAAYGAAGLHAQMREFGRGLGGRSFLALAIQLGVLH